MTDTERFDTAPAASAPAPAPASAPAPVPATPPGWYTDPGDPRRDRWWTGSEWATITARAPRSLYGPAFARSMRAGLNKDARLGTIFARVALLLWLLTTFLLRLGGPAAQLASTSALGLLPILVALAVAGIVFSVRGLAASKRLGGRILCLYSIYAAVAAIALPAVSLIFAFIVR